jgi:4-amino-4-deoxy-L-arabinose transferase-like glycosyltransferase
MAVAFRNDPAAIPGPRPLLISLILILLISFAVRGLTAYFIHTHLSEPAWFQSGTYQIFDRQAQDILDHKTSPFWIDDPSRTESAVYPPGYPIWIATIYWLTGQRSPASVQQFQWIIDSLSVLLLVGIGCTVYNIRVGLVAGLLAALSPLLALSGAVPLADSPTSWLVLGAAWLFVIAAQPSFPSFRDDDNTRITGGFLFVLIRVISWIGSFVGRRSDPQKLHEVTPTKSQNKLELSPSLSSPRSRLRQTVSTVSQHRSLIYFLLAGIFVGISCWFRANGLLLLAFWIAATVFLKTTWRARVQISGALLIGMLIVVTPLLVRNAVAFHAFTPTGLGAGTNLWEGLGETERAAEFGAVYGDRNLLEQERTQLGIPADDKSFSLYYPDGVKRDRERAQKALSIIRAHPVWYAGVMLRRMAGVLKFAGQPEPYYGSSGINVTGSKCLPIGLQGGLLSGLVTMMGMLQSVMRYLALPLMIVGIVISVSRDWRLTLLLSSTILYYLIVGSALHTEIRYGLPMQALLFLFAAVTLTTVAEKVSRRVVSKSP